MSLLKLTNIVLDSLVPALTQNLSIATQAVQDGTQTMLTQGAGLITKAGEISQNPAAFGFAFEHLHAIGFNLNAALKNSEVRAYQVPADGSTKLSPDIYIEMTGRIIAEIQAKTGSAKYVHQQTNSGHYSGNILTNTENANIPGTTDRIAVNGIESFPIHQQFAEWVAENPYFAANLIHGAAVTGEVVISGVESAAIQTEIEILLQSIKVIGAYCRGEQDLAQEEAYKIAQIATDSLKDGFVRGMAIKILQRVTGSKTFASLGFTISNTVVPIVIGVLRNELTVEAAIAQVGHRAFVAAVITPIILLFPPVGVTMIGLKVIQAIWAEISPEWKVAVRQAIAVSAIAASQSTELPILVPASETTEIGLLASN
jgi:hypothetical protein